MATRKRTPSVTTELHRMVGELHAHSAETRVLISTVVERLEKVEFQVAEQGKTLSWYEFSIKALKAVGALTILIVTLKLGDLPGAIKQVVTK